MTAGLARVTAGRRTTRPRTPVDADMDPRLLFPWLALALLLAALWRYAKTRQWRGAPLTWAVMAGLFAAVSAWLHRGA